MNWLKQFDPKKIDFWVKTISGLIIVSIFIAAWVESHYDEKHRQNALRYQLSVLQMSSVFKKLDYFQQKKNTVPANLDELVDFISKAASQSNEQNADDSDIKSVTADDREIKETLAEIGVDLYEDGWGNRLVLEDQSKQAGHPAVMVITKGPNGERDDDDDLSYQWPDDREAVNRR